MFLNYLDSDAKKINVQYNHGDALVRMSQMIVLIGDYKDEEIEYLETNLKKHFPVDPYVFWLCIGHAKVSSAQKKTYECFGKKDDFLEQRVEFGKIVSTQQFIHFCEEAVADIYNATARLICQEAGEVAVAVIYKADHPESGMAAPVIKKLKELLSEQFMSVNMDAYVLLDQSAYTERKAEKESMVYQTLNEAEQLIHDKIIRLSYVLSNIDNRGRLHEKEQVCEEAYASIALMISMKNLIPDNSVYGYSDMGYGKAVENFAQSIGIETGVLSSIGHMCLLIDKKIHSYVVYLTIWKKLAEQSEEERMKEVMQELGVEKDQISQYFASSYRRRSLDENDFETIVRNKTLPEQSIYTMKNDEAVARFFGNNLDLFYELNVRGNDSRQRMTEWFDILSKRLETLQSDITNMDIAYILSSVENMVQMLENESEELAENRRVRFIEWKSKIFSETHREKNRNQKNTNPLLKLAWDYLQIKDGVYISSKQKAIYEEVREKIADLSSYYKKYRILVSQTADSLEKVIAEKEYEAAKPGNGLGLLQVTNARNYYKNLTTELLTEHYDKEFKQLLLELRKLSSDRVFDEEKIYKLVLNFCNNYIFADPVFRMSFLEELQKRLMGYEEVGKWVIKSGTDVSNFLLTTITDAQHTLYCDAIQQGFQTYDEMCLFLQNDAIFMEEKDKDAHVANIIKEQKMKLFCDKHSDSLDVVFIAGNLKAVHLHKWSSYENSYRKLTEKR